jgi:transcriptional repressor NrdR
MRCPFCGALNTQVKDSRPAEDNVAIRRRRFCVECHERFTTFERIQLRELTVIKRNGRREIFDRDKLLRSIEVAVRKRNVEPERIDTIVNALVRNMENAGEPEINSQYIGELVMERLKALDDVAYVRYASVYRNFREARDFADLVSELSSKDLARADLGADEK